MTTLKYLMWLSCLTRLRPRAKNIALDYFGGIQELFFAGEKELSKIEGLSNNDIKQLSNKNMEMAMRSLEICQQKNIGMISIYDAAYPSRLKNIYDPPILLFTLGRLPVIDEEVAVAIVGTRKSTSYGDKTATKIGYEIGKCGGLIISGLAGGIDTAGAIGALQAGKACIGVLGTAIDVVYPASNRRIYRDIISVGAIISEYPPGAEYSPMNFPNRNRIISGLSLGVVILEAPKKSGALITAERAVEQGRDIFVVPGNIDAINCVGSNALLKDGAKPTMSGFDVLEEYVGIYPHKIDIEKSKVLKAPETKYQPRSEMPTKSKKMPPKPKPAVIKESDFKPEIGKAQLEDKLKDLSERQLEIVSAFDTPTCDIDEIIDKTKISSLEVMTELGMLEILGIVTSDGFNRYTVNF